MDFFSVLSARHSVRRYRPDPVPAEAIENLYRALKYAPSAKNLQPWKFLVITDPETRKRISEACPQQQLAEAPAIIAVVGDEAAAWHRPEGDSIIALDVGIAMEHMLLAAANDGLGSCWICAYDMAKVDAALDVKAPRHVYALSPLGYAASAVPEAPHKERGEVFEVIG